VPRGPPLQGCAVAPRAPKSAGPQPVPAPSVPAPQQLRQSTTAPTDFTGSGAAHARGLRGHGSYEVEQGGGVAVTRRTSAPRALHRRAPPQHAGPMSMRAAAARKTSPLRSLCRRAPPQRVGPRFREPCVDVPPPRGGGASCRALPTDSGLGMERDLDLRLCGGDWPAGRRRPSQFTVGSPPSQVAAGS
jgi:hypothetical protein